MSSPIVDDVNVIVEFPFTDEDLRRILLENHGLRCVFPCFVSSTRGMTVRCMLERDEEAKLPPDVAMTEDMICKIFPQEFSFSSIAHMDSCKRTTPFKVF